MEKTWRWFGPDDRIPLKQLRQIGVEGIVTALHHIPNGEVWSRHEIQKRRHLIESEGLRWSVVESLPVTEDIKLGRGESDMHLRNYCGFLPLPGFPGTCNNFSDAYPILRGPVLYLL